MKTYVRVLALITGLLFLVGCDLTRSWLPIAVDRTQATATITGRVVDAANNDLPNALVSNGAAVALSGADGSFTLSNVTLGVQYITATFDGKKSNPVEIEVRDDRPNHIDKLIIDRYRPVSDQSSAIKFIQVLPDTLIASYSVSIATDSLKDGNGDPVLDGDGNPQVIDVIHYSPTRYTNGKDVVITVAAPPGGAGAVLKSYRVSYEDNYDTPYKANFPSPMVVGPGSLTESGPNKNLNIKYVGPASETFSNNLATGSLNVVEATITLYAVDKDAQDTSEPIYMHAPTQGDKDATASFEVNVYIQKSDD